ncbi:FecCD family ABC transporter permease [Paroceanicella profunda]
MIGARGLGGRHGWHVPLAAGVLVLAMILGLGAGPFDLGPARILGLLAGRLAGEAPPDAAATVLFSIRLPRVLGAALVGAALAAAGAAYQVTFRNPLVSPDILGVSSGAGLGAVLGIFLGLPVAAILGMSFGAGLATVGLVVAVASGLGRGQDILALALCGIAVGALAGAGISLIKVLADPEDQLPAITFWLLGSLAGLQGGDLRLAAPAILLGLVPLVALRWRIGLLALGEDEARALGVDTARLRLVVVLSATLMSASAVAVAGVVGWIGLMVPHVARLLTGPGFARLLPVAALLGAAFLVLVDTVARSVAATEVPLGLLTAVIGAPVFLGLLARSDRGWS